MRPIQVDYVRVTFSATSVNNPGDVAPLELYCNLIPFLKRCRAYGAADGEKRQPR